MAEFVSTSSLDCYFVLGVRPDATVEEIEAAYRKALIPAGTGFSALARIPLVRQESDTIRYAYKTLSDPVSRECFDAWRRKCALSFFPPF